MYSAGAVLYHFLTGSIPIPWTGNYLDIIQVKPVPPSQRRRELDPALDAVILKALEKDPRARYQNGDEFAAALQRWLDGARPVAPAPQPLPSPVDASAPFAGFTSEPSALESERARSTLRSLPRRPPPEPEPAPPTPKRTKGLRVLGMLALVLGGMAVTGVAAVAIWGSGKNEIAPPTQPKLQKWKSE